MKVATPLRFPGSKARLIPYVQKFVERNYLVGRTVVEPFAGSAGVSLGLLASKHAAHAVLIEKDPLLFSFWKTVFDHPEKLTEMLRKERCSLRRFDYWLRYLDVKVGDAPTEKLGFAYLFLNRTSYSGIVGAGPIGGRSQASAYSIDCRYNPTQLIKQIFRLARFRNHVTVKFGNALRQLLSYDNEEYWLFVDPPYYENGKKFYRFPFKETQHQLLSQKLRRVRAPWLLTYDNAELIKSYYAKSNSIQLEFYQSANAKGAKREVAFSNVRLDVNRSRQEVWVAPSLLDAAC